MYLTPPWAPGFTLSEEQARARATYRRLLTERDDAAIDDAEFAKLGEEWEQANRRGDDAAAELVQRRIDELAKAAESRRLQRLRAEGAEAVDLELIDLYEQYQAEAAEATEPSESEAEDVAARFEIYRARQEAWDRLVGARMGQLPLDGETPPPAELVYAAQAGAVRRTGLAISFQWLSFHRGDTGSLRLLDWLCQRGFVDLRYTIESPMSADQF
jgi:hypothetical protein